MRWLWNILDPAVTMWVNPGDGTMVLTAKVPLWQRVLLGRGR